MRPSFCVFLITAAAWAGICKAQQRDVGPVIDAVYALCVGSGEQVKVTAISAGTLDLSLQRLLSSGTVVGEVRVERTQVRGVVEGLTSMMSSLQAQQADKVRDCIAPFREKIMDVVLYPGGRPLASKPVYELMFANPNITRLRLESDLGPAIARSSHYISSATRTVGRLDTQVNAELFENEDLIAYFGRTRDEIVYVAALFKRYPESLTRVLEGRGISTSMTLADLQSKLPEQMAFAMDLDNIRQSRILVEALRKNGTVLSSSDMRQLQPTDPGTPGEIIGVLNLGFYSGRFGLLYHFPQSALCDKSGGFLGMRETVEKLADLRCDQPRKVGHLIAAIKLHDSYFRLADATFATSMQFYAGTLRNAAVAAGFWARPTLRQGPNR